MKCILICGQAGAGKSTVAEILKEFLDTDKYGHRHEVTYVRNNGETAKLIAKSRGWNGVKDKEGRQMLIDITDEKYKQDKYFFEQENYVHFLMFQQGHPSASTLIVPDWRYKVTEEYNQRVFDRIIRIKVQRPNTIGTHKGHSSEEDFKSFNVDYVVNNNGDLNDLRRKIGEFVYKI